MHYPTEKLKKLKSRLDHYGITYDPLTGLVYREGQLLETPMVSLGVKGSVPRGVVIYILNTGEYPKYCFKSLDPDEGYTMVELMARILDRRNPHYHEYMSPYKPKASECDEPVRTSTESEAFDALVQIPSVTKTADTINIMLPRDTMSFSITFK